MSTDKATPMAAPPRRALSSILAMVFRSAGVLAVLAVPAVSSLGPVDAGTPGERPERAWSTVWKADYSERFPGCVPSVLWPEGERPVAVVTRSPDGSIAKVALHGHRPDEVLTGGAHAIGACR